MMCAALSASATGRGELRVGMVETFPQPGLLVHTHLGATGPETVTRKAGVRVLEADLQIGPLAAGGLCPGEAEDHRLPTAQGV